MKLSEKIWNRIIKGKLLIIIAVLLLSVGANLLFMNNRIQVLLNRNAEERLDTAVLSLNSEVNNRENALSSIADSLSYLNSIEIDESKLLRFFGRLYNNIKFDSYLDGTNSSLYQTAKKIEEIHGVLNSNVLKGNTSGLIELKYSAKGIVRFDSSPTNEVWYKAAVNADGKMTVTDKYKNKNNDEVISFAQAFYNEQHQLAGVVAIDLTSDIISDAVSPYVIGNESIVVLGSDLETIGTVQHKITSDKTNKVTDYIKEQSKQTSRFLTSTDVVFSKSNANGMTVLMYVPINEYYSEWMMIIFINVILGTVFVIVLLFALNRIIASQTRISVSYKNKFNFFNRINNELSIPLNAIINIGESILKEELSIHTHLHIVRAILNSKELISISESAKILCETGNAEKPQSNFSKSNSASFNDVKYNSIDLLNPLTLAANEMNVKIDSINSKYKSEHYSESPDIIYSFPGLGALKESKNLFLKIRINPELPRTLNGDKAKINSASKIILEEAIYSSDSGDIIFSLDRKFIDFNTVEIIISVQFNISSIYEQEQKTETTRIVLLKKIAESLNDGAKTELFTFESKFEQYKQKMFELHIEQKILDVMPLGTEQEHEETSFHKSFSAPSAKILVIRKDENENLLAECLLKPFSVQTDTSVSLKEAMSKIGYQIEYDIIFVPQNMTEVLSSVRRFKDGDKSVVIAMTSEAYDTDTSRRYSMKGFDGFVRFPFEYSSLYNILMYHLPKSKVITNSNLSNPEHNMQIYLAFQSEIRKSIPEMNLDDAILSSGGEKNFIRALVKFVNTIDNYVQSINSSISLRERREYLAKFGELKKFCVILGLRELYGKARELEISAKNGDFDFCTEHTAAFSDELLRIKDLIEKTSVKELADGRDKENYDN
jgi:HPt (histidine-containing phosphotransfer) domain-containing protein